jgi:hypothetical protein
MQKLDLDLFLDYIQQVKLEDKYMDRIKRDEYIIIF